MNVYKINFGLLKKIRENDGKCLCKIDEPCPCDDFINKKGCHCGVFIKKIKKKKGT